MQTQYIFNHYQQPSSKVTAPLNDEILGKMSQFVVKKQWVLLTAECPRSTLQRALRSHTLGHNMVQMKPSHTLSQFQVVEKAICSGNACAVIANGYFTTAEQARLRTLALEFDCELINLDGEHRVH